MLDARVKQDPKSKVACDAVTTDKMVEAELTIQTQAKINYDEMARGVFEQLETRRSLNRCASTDIDVSE